MENFDENGTALKPSWIKLRVLDLAYILNIEDCEGLKTEIENDPNFLEKLGVVFVNTILYSSNRNSELLEVRSRDMRFVQREMFKCVDSSYDVYEKRVESGKKGGRPRNELKDE